MSNMHPGVDLTRRVDLVSLGDALIHQLNPSVPPLAFTKQLPVPKDAISGVLHRTCNVRVVGT
jgi:hypothetical protein